METLEHKNWPGTTYGSGRMHQWLTALLRVVPLPVIYVFSAIFVVPVTMLINRKAVRSIYSYFHDRLGYGPLKSAISAYRNHCDFSGVVVDRFAMYAGKKFKFDIEGEKFYKSLTLNPEGFILLSAHIGNYEIAGYSLRAEHKRFNALVFMGEKESVMKGREALFGENNIRMIPIRPDMSHLLDINSALSAGEILSIPADRIFGSPKYFSLPFMGTEAKFPQGPFAIAATMRLPVLFVSVMKKGLSRYQINVQPLKEPDALSRTILRARSLAEDYVGKLEATLRVYPTQWYNFFDFWAQ